MYLRLVTSYSNHHCNSPLVDRDGVSVNNELVIILSDFTTVTAMGRVILEHVDLEHEDAGLGDMKLHDFCLH